MLHLVTGTDSDRAREYLNEAVEKVAKNAAVIRITDAHRVADLQMSFQGGGMFGRKQVVVLDGTLTNDEMRDVVMGQLDPLKKSTDTFFIFESAPDAATRKQLEKYAETKERFDAAKTAKPETIFGLVRSLQSAKKKDLWVGYQREIAKGKAPEAIHGMLFYAAKDALLRNPKDDRAKKLVAKLAALPHEARRRGYEFEYALEEFVLADV